MISYLYLSFRNVILLVLTVTLLLGTLLTNKDIVPFLANKYADEYGVKYSKIEGTLLFGVKIEELQYEDFLSAKSISVRYDFLSLLRLSPKISNITSDSLYLNIDKIVSSDSDESSSFNTDFTVKKLLLKNINLEYKKELYNFDINGSISSNVLKAHSTVVVTPSISKEYLGFLQTAPQTLECQLQIDTKNIKVTTKFKTLKLKDIKELAFKELVANLNYSMQNKKLNGELTYKLLYNKYTLKTEQNIDLDLEGNYTSYITAKLTQTPYALPFKNINAEVSGDSQKIVINLDANKFHYKMQSNDYNNFTIKGGAKELKLSFTKELPQLLQKDTISFTNKLNLKLSPLRLNSMLKVKSLYYILDVNATLKDGDISAIYLLNPKRDSTLFKEFPIEKLSPLKGSYLYNGTDERVDIKANLLKLKLLKKGTTIKGDGRLSSSKFTFSTELEQKEPLELKLDIKIASLKKILKEFEVKDKKIKSFSDIKLDIKSSIILGNKTIVKSSIFIPSISYRVDEQTTYLAKNIRVKTSFSENRLTLDSYNLEYETFPIYSNKKSHILLQNDSELLFREFWIFDNLLLSGVYKTEKQVGNFSIKSDKFHYKEKKTNVNLKMDLNASFDLKSTKLQGSVTLLDGNISYMPSSDYTIIDPDIIILQEIKKKKKSQVLMDIKIDSSKDILYINKNANIYFRPDARLIKTPTKETHLIGKVNIAKGEVNFSDKKFLFDKSKLFFDGSIPMNPKLNLSLHYYTLNYIDILISVTNTLEMPVFIFSSNPVMSQNDIMSYILFGESASSMFNSSGDTSKTSLLLGTGIKKLFNTNSSIKLDTLNILTNKDGSLGYEIGSRIRKDMRLVYKNDTVSSVILQYTLSKSTRVDIDVREVGQGVSFIYLKDFE